MNEKMQKAVERFTVEIVGIVRGELEEAINLRPPSMASVARSMVDFVAGANGHGRPRPRPRPRHRMARGLLAGQLKPLIDTMKRAKGTAVRPGVISKALGLSPSQRRRLVQIAVKKGLMKVTGRRRAAMYTLVRR